MLSYSLILDSYVLFLIIQNQSLDYILRALHNSYFLKEDGLFFSSKAPGLVFSATYLRGSFAHLPASGGISPTDTLRKDSALTPVTSEKSTLFIGVTKIVRFCKALNSMPYFFQFSIKGSTSDSGHLLKDNLQDTINFP